MNLSEYSVNSENTVPGVPACRYGFLGGTFDPVHYGHIDIADKIYLEYSLSCVFFLVSGDPPHKSGITPAGLRYEMVKKAVAGRDYLRVSDAEINREGKIYTADTLGILRKEFPRDEFFYIIGADTLFEIETWKDPERVCALTDFICIGRPGISQKDCLSKSRELSDKFDARILLSEYSGPDISSTAVREYIEEGNDFSGLVAPEVEDYIRKNGLYKRQG